MANGHELNVGESHESYDESRVVLALDEATNLVLFALPRDSVEIWIGRPEDDGRKLLEVDPYTFRWMGGFLGREHFYVVEFRAVTIYEIKSGKLVVAWEGGAELTSGSERHLAVATEGEIQVINVFGSSREDADFVSRIDNEHRPTAIVLESGELGVGAYDGWIYKFHLRKV